MVLGFQTGSSFATYPRSPCFAITDLMNPAWAGLTGGLLNMANEEKVPWAGAAEEGPPPYNHIECALMHYMFYKKIKKTKPSTCICGNVEIK